MQQGQEIDYQMLILKHLQNISNLSGIVQGDILKDGQLIIQHKEDDKKLAFTWQVRVLEALIPKDNEDQMYRAEMECINENHANREGFNYNIAQLRALVNLLQRIGLLLPSGEIALIGPEEIVNADL